METWRRVSVRTISDAICRTPGITPIELAEGTGLPILETMRTLHRLWSEGMIEWAGEVVDAVTPTYLDAAVQLQTIASVTGLDVERPL
jgi:hypothetical protein